MIRITFPLGLSVGLCAAFASLASAQQFAQIPGVLTQVSAGGASVWGINASNGIYQFNWGAGLFAPIPGFLTQIAVGPGYSACHPYEVWGLNSGLIFRYNYCSGSFEQVPGVLSQIAVGDGQVWGVNPSNLIYRFDLTAGHWVQVPGVLNRIAVGAAGVWGMDPSNNWVYRFNPDTGSFTHINGVLTQIAVGGNGVWGINLGQLYRFDESNQSFPQITGLPGVLFSRISVGTGAGVWALDQSNLIYTFTGSTQSVLQ